MLTPRREQGERERSADVAGESGAHTVIVSTPGRVLIAVLLEQRQPALDGVTCARRSW